MQASLSRYTPIHERAQIPPSQNFGSIRFSSPDGFQRDVVAASMEKGNNGSVFTHLPSEIFTQRATATKVIVGDMDGTFVTAGLRELPQMVIEQDYHLSELGIRKVYCTGKPVSELETIAERLVHQGVLKGNIYPATFLLEKGAFEARITSTGQVIVENLLIDSGLAESIEILKQRFFSEWRQKISEVHGVQLELAGDGRHQAVFSVDVLRHDRPDDFKSEHYKDRSEIKVHDKAKVDRIFKELCYHIEGLRLPGLKNINPSFVGEANMELSDASINKADAVVKYFERREISMESQIATVGDSRNDLELYQKILKTFPTALTCHTVWDPQCFDLLGLVQSAVIGATYGAAFVDRIIKEKNGAPDLKDAKLPSLV